jgi:hypothetical protein
MLYFIAICFVLRLHMLLPFIVICVYLGDSCFVLHILLNQKEAFVVSSFSFVPL